jgi:hypothetical protein
VTLTAAIATLLAHGYRATPSGDRVRLTIGRCVCTALPWDAVECCLGLELARRSALVGEA